MNAEESSIFRNLLLRIYMGLDQKMKSDSLNLEVRGVAVRLAYLRREGTLPALVCLHGFGSTKEDYADLALHPDFQNRELVFWDAPGCGVSETSDPEALSIPFLVEVVVGRLRCSEAAKNFTCQAHSMGGLTALMFAHAHPDRVLSFIDIEGNLAPEDCFLSRQIIEHPAETPEAFLDGFRERVRQRWEYASALFAATLPIKVQATTVKPIFQSMVDLSDKQATDGKHGSADLPKSLYLRRAESPLVLPETLARDWRRGRRDSPFGAFPYVFQPPLPCGQTMGEILSRHEMRR